MVTTDQESTPPRRRIPFWLVILLLAAIPSGYFYMTGRLGQNALQREVDGLLHKTEALADSLDGVRTHLMLGAAQASIRKGYFESAQPLTSDFFDRVDRRTRKEGVGPGETEARMELLALRDRTISALSRRAPGAGILLEELATLHLGLVDPELMARLPSPTTPGVGTQDSLRVPPTGLPRRYPPRDTLPR
jgi:hypothetical protein